MGKSHSTSNKIRTHGNSELFWRKRLRADVSLCCLLLVYVSFVVHRCLCTLTRVWWLHRRTHYYSLSHDLVLLREFEERFPNTAFPSCQMLHNMHRKFQRMSSVADAPHSGRLHDARTEENQYAVVMSYSWEFHVAPTEEFYKTSGFTLIVLCYCTLKFCFCKFWPHFFNSCKSVKWLLPSHSVRTS